MYADMVQLDAVLLMQVNLSWLALDVISKPRALEMLYIQKFKWNQPLKSIDCILYL